MQILLFLCHTQKKFTFDCLPLGSSSTTTTTTTGMAWHDVRTFVFMNEKFPPKNNKIFACSRHKKAKEAERGTRTTTTTCEINT